MRITHLIPGTGHFYCGSCLRDYALVRALQGLGHELSVVPLYLPAYLEDGVRDGPVRMGGINMYLQQLWSGFARLPRWMHDRLDAPRLLRWSSARGDMTDAASVAALTVSILRGESGRQQAELDRLVGALRDQPRPDVVAISNAMLLGLAGRVRRELGCPLVCSLQGEAPFLDSLPPRPREEAWSVLRERAADADAFVAVSRYTADLMTGRLDLDPAAVHVVHNGIEAADFARDGLAWPHRPVVGYLARMCADKGLPTLVEAYCRLRAAGRVEGARLLVAGVQLRADRPLVRRLRRRLREAGCDGDASFHPNVERREKIGLLHRMSVLSVPATYGESFGLYVLEALAAGVPVVQPRHAAFPEVLDATGGGVLCAADDPDALAAAIETLLLDPQRARELGERGRRVVEERFTVERMARGVEGVYRAVTAEPAGDGPRTA